MIDDAYSMFQEKIGLLPVAASLDDAAARAAPCAAQYTSFFVANATFTVRRLFCTVVLLCSSMILFASAKFEIYLGA